MHHRVLGSILCFISVLGHLIVYLHPIKCSLCITSVYLFCSFSIADNITINYAFIRLNTREWCKTYLVIPFMRRQFHVNATWLCLVLICTIKDTPSLSRDMDREAGPAPCFIRSFQGTLSILRELIDLGFEVHFVRCFYTTSYSGITSLWHSRLSTGLY